MALGQPDPKIRAAADEMERAEMVAPGGDGISRLHAHDVEHIVPQPRRIDHARPALGYEGDGAPVHAQIGRERALRGRGGRHGGVHATDPLGRDPRQQVGIGAVDKKPRRPPFIGLDDTLGEPAGGAVQRRVCAVIEARTDQGGVLVEACDERRPGPIGGGGDVAHERLGLDGGGDDQLLPLAQIEAGRHAKGGEARLEVVECHKVPRICLTAAGDSI
ncbi:conserved hypothetical protein [Ricinus communis]|uniref:Uncharacterized protein n=1 Tax=Ricinus communis TaxID=3988 RepID=B9TKA4_RICCO|nr:conserved hypothetical protein [Ricinus communis]